MCVLFMLSSTELCTKQDEQRPAGWRRSLKNHVIPRGICPYLSQTSFLYLGKHEFAKLSLFHPKIKFTYVQSYNNQRKWKQKCTWKYCLSFLRNYANITCQNKLILFCYIFIKNTERLSLPDSNKERKIVAVKCTGETLFPLLQRSSQPLWVWKQKEGNHNRKELQN